MSAHKADVNYTIFILNSDYQPLGIAFDVKISSEFWQTLEVIILKKVGLGPVIGVVVTGMY